MNNLSLHIEYLLRYHDCVILPGIGAFMKSYREAIMDENGSIFPPATELTFNSSIQSNDGLVAHSIMRRNNSTFEEARAQMSQAVEEIKALLKSDREFAFGHIGILSLGQEDNVSFHPFATPDIKAFRAVVKEKVEKTDSSASGTEQSTESESKRKFDTIRNYYIPVNKRFAKVAAVVFVVLAAASTFVIPNLKPTSHRSDVQRASVMPIEWSVQSSSESKEKEADYEINASSDASSDIQSIEYDFYLVVGAFNTLEECNYFISHLPEESAKQLKILKDNKVYKIYAAASDNRRELKEMLKDEDFHSQFSNAWIWRS